MILIALALAAQAAPSPGSAEGDGMRPEVEAAFDHAQLGWLLCMKARTDAVPRRERRARTEAVADAAIAACVAEEDAMRSVLRRQYNQPSVDRLMVSFRQAIRENMIGHLRRGR